MFFLKQPLIHFLVLGGLFFIIFDIINDGEGSLNERQINVDREIILDFIIVVNFNFILYKKFY